MKRPRLSKQSKVLDRQYLEAECRDCSVVVTQMDFAKILGKFTKVKIQYESSSPQPQKSSRQVTSPNTNARLKSNENGMVLIHRNAYKEHPVKELNSKNPLKTYSNTAKSKSVNNNNILKENNRLKKTTSIVKDKFEKVTTKKIGSTGFKKYGIIFVDPISNQCKDPKNTTSLLDLLPSIDKNILPSDEWSIDYLPHTEEPKEDKVYDRIAAELEDLMYNEKSIIAPSEKNEGSESKDDFPSILDILNETPSEGNNAKPTEENGEQTSKPSIGSSEVEAMLLDDSGTSKPLETNDSTIDSLIEDVGELPTVTEPEQKGVTNIEEPGSPSILDEALEKGIAEQLPEKSSQEETIKQSNNGEAVNEPAEPMETDEHPGESSVANQPKTTIEIESKGPAREITHLVFKKVKDGACHKSVTCPKTLKYSIEFLGKPVELLGAPKFISSREDLQVLLQIVNESELESFYVLQ
ncbi:unnamed protein product [Plutella xylostella]|uniref:(diamondback moth) hypothetical protein n=1 Tax=Plutella xylostella TaxID=51655 RepID=A0A8S4DKL5_PLUXY|nr:unnamed protein product [Plutella xylostella]